jgi:hypothetical protein
MVPVAIAGNISGEATTPSGNIFNEATRGFKDLLAAGHELCIASLGPRWCLRGIVGREGLDRCIAKLRCHAPHIRECVGVASRLITERVQLGLQIWSGLAGKIRKRGRNAVAAGAMTVRAGGFRQLVSRAPELGGNLGRLRSPAQHSAGGKCHAECERLQESRHVSSSAQTSR